MKGGRIQDLRYRFQLVWGLDGWSDCFESYQFNDVGDNSRYVAVRLWLCVRTSLWLSFREWRQRHSGSIIYRESKRVMGLKCRNLTGSNDDGSGMMIAVKLFKAF